MVRNIFTDKWIIGGVLLLIIIAGGCYFWYQHSLADDRKAAAETAEYARQLENQKAKQEAATAETESTQAPAKSTTPTAEKHVNEATGADTSTDATTKSVIVSVQETDNTEEVRVSPHWFVPYPEVPDDYPLITPFWVRNPTAEGIPLHAAAPLELLDLVLVKLWIQGDRNIQGAATSEGKVYVYYPDVIYVKYENVTLPNGKVKRKIRRTLSGPSLGKYGPPHIRDGTVPAHIKLVDFNDGGIDPHIFLKENSK